MHAAARRDYLERGDQPAGKLHQKSQECLDSNSILLFFQEMNSHTSYQWQNMDCKNVSETISALAYVGM